MLYRFDMPILPTSFHWSPSVPFNNSVNPRVAPTTECVVETGALNIVANNNQQDAPPRIASCPNDQVKDR